MFSKDIIITITNPRTKRAAQDPPVKIDLDGSKLTYPLGETIPVNCTAKCGPGKGSLQWEIVYVDEERVLRGSSSETRESGNREIITSKLPYKAKMEHDGQKLRCVYIERDGSGEITDEKTDEVDLEITYIKNLKIQGNLTARAGEDLDVLVEFEAKPEPDLKDMIWTINKIDGTSTNVGIFNSNYREQDYESFPLGHIGIQSYYAKFTFYDIQEDVGNSTFTIQHKGELSKKHVKPKAIQFTIEVMASENLGKLSTSHIVGVVVVIVIVIAIPIAAICVWVIRRCNNRTSQETGTHEEMEHVDTTR